MNRMNSTLLCPISTQKMNESVARLNATFTVLFLVLFLLSQNILWIFVLITDFALRSFNLSKFSPLAQISNQLISIFAIKQKIINAGPKIFAARIAIMFNVLIIISHFSNLREVTLILTSIFLICALLETVIGFCVACKIYTLISVFSKK